ncbi:MAG TPA: GNAT family N-acetyltransferase, partial [Anaerolineae bacterium]
MAYSIRRASADDIDDLCLLFHTLDRLHHEALPDVVNLAPLEEPIQRDYLLSTFDTEGAAMFVAEAAEKMLGAVLVLCRGTRDIPVLVPRRLAMIEKLIVRDDARRRGIGKALLQAAQQWAAEQGATQVELNVWEFNKEAIRFYQREGYETASRRMWLTLTANRNTETPVASPPVELVEASDQYFPVVQALSAYYIYDMSEYLGWRCPESGHFGGCDEFFADWQAGRNHPYILR